MIDTAVNRILFARRYFPTLYWCIVSGCARPYCSCYASSPSLAPSGGILPLAIRTMMTRVPHHILIQLQPLMHERHLQYCPPPRGKRRDLVLHASNVRRIPSNPPTSVVVVVVVDDRSSRWRGVRHIVPQTEVFSSVSHDLDLRLRSVWHIVNVP